MENAADALKIAFAIFVFVIAIAITFSIISQAKSTADVVLYHTDETNFYDYSYSGSKEKNRNVSVSEVILTLYRYYKESICVTINLGSEEETYKFDTNLSKFELEKLRKKLGLRQAPSTHDEIKSMLAKFVKNILLANYSDATFKEEFIEAQIGSIYETKEKIYITYKLNK